MKNTLIPSGEVASTSKVKGDIVNDPEEVMEHKFFKKNELPEKLNEYDKRIILEWAERQ
ncbi:hypothetical protein [Butyrivibrio fibrisolvens]|uniref:hypothetical protein n=1 Tax=Butyrivibrio fibrisolvens TaxID=831 RepID=UPI00041874FE|nr:hypothetical protein [Butyrivibrio fibrisolvens]